MEGAIEKDDSFSEYKNFNKRTNQPSIQIKLSWAEIDHP